MAQPEMASLVEQAETLGWLVAGYEADHRPAPFRLRRTTMSPGYSAWREEEQARNLLALIVRAGRDQRFLVLGGWGHV